MKRPEERLEALRRELWGLLVPHAQDRRTHQQRLEDLQDAIWSVAVAPPVVQENGEIVSRETSAGSAVPCGADCGPWCAERCEACS